MYIGGGKGQNRSIGRGSGVVATLDNSLDLSEVDWGVPDPAVLYYLYSVH